MSTGPVDVQITFGDLQTGEAALFIEQTNNEVWTDYMAYNRYESDSRRYMMGVASPNGFQGKSVAFVQLAAKTLLWVCDWTACKMNGDPDIPDPASTDSNWVLLEEFPEMAMVGVGPDGQTPINRISGVYIYGHVNPSASTWSDVDAPKPPWLNITPSKTRKLTAGLSNPSGGGGSSSSSTGAQTVPFDSRTLIA